MTKKTKHTELPLIYSCSGVSNVAQLANAAAVDLDRAGEAEMSCIAGVGGDIPSLVRKAQSGRHIIAVDGCPLACVKHSLTRHDVEPDRHLLLSDYGFRKHRKGNVHQDDIEYVKQLIRDEHTPVQEYTENVPSEKITN
ncbi:MAG: putative zinc-binding protein [Candidatus Marinimicrobia bacterium]|nr:putative zinc-binding protein [Candidatus Neomarinimicrobiota bacterium]MCF7829530.1 putative zinc-binding protein [Candidatus Neomarinimicrobiota bacterium]MCF7880072.1 putative zinc-binding protein [Candidatus Neomarinimicrobiota bacterium]